MKKSPWSGGEGDVVVVAAALPNDDGDVSEDGAAKSLLLNSILFFVTKVSKFFTRHKKKARVK